MKAIYGPKIYGASQLFSADEVSLISDKDMILERWAGHFHSVLNRPSSTNDEATDCLPQVEVSLLLAELSTEKEGFPCHWVPSAMIQVINKNLK